MRGCTRLGCFGAAVLGWRPAAGTCKRSPRRFADRIAASSIAAYPDFLDPPGKKGTSLIWRDGTRMAISTTARPKALRRWLGRPGHRGHVRDPLPGRRSRRAPPATTDPGRSRNLPFFDKMYGDCRKGEVRKLLAEGRMAAEEGAPETHGFTSVNGVDRKLAAGFAPNSTSCPKSSTHSRARGRHLQLPPDRRNERALSTRPRHRHRHRDEAHRLLALDEARRRRNLRLQEQHPGARSYASSSATASSGAEGGITTTRCISSTGRSCCPRAHQSGTGRSGRLQHATPIRAVRKQSALRNPAKPRDATCLAARADRADSIRRFYVGGRLFARRDPGFGGSSNGRTADSDFACLGSNPSPPATHDPSETPVNTGLMRGSRNRF